MRKLMGKNRRFVIARSTLSVSLLCTIAACSSHDGVITSRENRIPLKETTLSSKQAQSSPSPASGVGTLIIVKEVDVWNSAKDKFETVTLRGQAQQNKASGWQALLSPDGKIVGTVSEPGLHDGQICLGGAQTGLLQKVLGKIENNEGGNYLSNAFSPDPKTFLTGSIMEGTRSWGVNTGKVKARTPDASAGSIAFSPDGNFFASSEGDLVFRDAKTLRALRRIKMPNGLYFGELAFSPDDKTIVSGDFDETSEEPCDLRLWDASTGKSKGVLPAESQWINDVVFSHNSRLVASIEQNDDTTKCRIWNVRSRKVIKTMRDVHSANSVAFSRDDSRVLFDNGLTVSL
ncbi:MAG TPA: hypothetical protein VGB77_12345 [Abditibacteriaceae bacterium]|jgi:WD40 repeat protein